MWLLQTADNSVVNQTKTKSCKTMLQEACSYDMQNIEEQYPLFLNTASRVISGPSVLMMLWALIGLVLGFAWRVLMTMFVFLFWECLIALPIMAITKDPAVSAQIVFFFNMMYLVLTRPQPPVRISTRAYYYYP
ncbi:hypothetical protein F5X99DRAFT_409619 [Biscogniauxia marginata]|nr:hypothetical protein F5X99DRAFT_409619 [Biscogniauxia marginata]